MPLYILQNLLPSLCLKVLLKLRKFLFALRMLGRLSVLSVGTATCAAIVHKLLGI